LPTKLPVRFVPPVSEEMPSPLRVMLPPIVVLWDVAERLIENVDPLPFTVHETWFGPPSAIRFGGLPGVPIVPIWRNDSMPLMPAQDPPFVGEIVAKMKACAFGDELEQPAATTIPVKIAARWPRRGKEKRIRELYRLRACGPKRTARIRCDSHPPQGKVAPWWFGAFGRDLTGAFGRGLTRRVRPRPYPARSAAALPGAFGRFEAPGEVSQQVVRMLQPHG